MICLNLFRLNNGFRLSENKHGCQAIAEKNFQKRHFIGEPSYKILHDSWSTGWQPRPGVTMPAPPF